MRKIKAYKDGRTAQIRARLTPEAKEKLELLADRTGNTQADILHYLLQQDIDELIKYVDRLTDYGANDPTN